MDEDFPEVTLQSEFVAVYVTSKLLLLFGTFWN